MALPSYRPPTVIGDQSSSSASELRPRFASEPASFRLAFQPISDRHLRLTFQPSPRTNFQPSSSIDFSSPAFQSTADRHRRSIFRPRLPNPLPIRIGASALPPCLRANLRPSSSIDLPAQPSNPTSDFHRISSAPALLSCRLSDFHRPTDPSARPSGWPPTFIGCHALRRCHRRCFRRALTVASPAVPAARYPTCIGPCDLGLPVLQARAFARAHLFRLADCRLQRFSSRIRLSGGASDPTANSPSNARARLSAKLERNLRRGPALRLSR
jgi:hypothetical protein